MEKIRSIYRNVFKTPDADDYLYEAELAAAYLNTQRVETEHGLCWSIEESKRFLTNYYDEICMYAGSTGIAHYFVQLWQATGKEAYLADAKEAARYLIWRWNEKRDLAKCFCRYALTTGYGGVAMFLTEMYDITKDGKYRETVTDIMETAIREAKPSPDGTGYFWSTFPGVVGDGSVILILLTLGKKFAREDWVKFAVEAGRIYLNKAHDYPDGGRYYLGVDPAYFGAGEDYIDPNFPMGTCGIGYILLKLYEETGERCFLEAVDGIHDFVKALALQDEEKTAALLPHGIPKRPDVYYLNYCHGPVGTVRFYHEMHKVTGDPEYADWERKFANGIIKTGAPEYLTQGYWYILCVCCGTAGMVNSFLGLWAKTGEQQYFDWAERCARVLLGHSRREETSDGTIIAKWYQAFAYVAQDQVTANLGMYDGVAGIGWALLQMSLAKRGKDQFFAARAVDDPYPERFEA